MAKGNSKQKFVERLGISGDFIGGTYNSLNVDSPINLDSLEMNIGMNNDASDQSNKDFL